VENESLCLLEKLCFQNLCLVILHDLLFDAMGPKQACCVQGKIVSFVTTPMQVLLFVWGSRNHKKVELHFIINGMNAIWSQHGPSVFHQLALI